MKKLIPKALNASTQSRHWRIDENGNKLYISYGDLGDSYSEAMNTYTYYL